MMVNSKDTFLPLDGVTFLPLGKIATIVTYLEMTTPPDWLTRIRDSGPPQRACLYHQLSPDLDWYRALFRAVGVPWLWFSRLLLNDEELKAILCHSKIQVYHVTVDGMSVGFMELDRRKIGQVEIAFFGLKPSFIRCGIGSAMMQETLQLAWHGDELVERIWLHTCTLDHPGALIFYQSHGFQVYKRAVEVMDDPRLTGILPKTAGMYAPLIMPGSGFEGENSHEQQE